MEAISQLGKCVYVGIGGCLSARKCSLNTIAVLLLFVVVVTTHASAAAAAAAAAFHRRLAMLGPKLMWPKRPWSPNS